MRIELPSKILIENINVLKAKAEKEYSEDSNNLFENIKWELINEINQNIKESKQLNTDTYISKDFPWGSKCAIKPYLKLLVNKNQKSRKLLFSESEMHNNWLEQDPDVLIAEAAFGSFCDEIESIKSKNDITLAQINKIDFRRLSVFKILNIQSFSRNQDSKYCKMILNQITEEISKASINQHNERVAGWQRECLLSEDEILEKPFEAIKQLSSSRGRLIILKNWDKIIRLPNFVYQSVLKDVYGVSISKTRSELSKYLNNNILNIIL